MINIIYNFKIMPEFKRNLETHGLLGLGESTRETQTHEIYQCL